MHLQARGRRGRDARLYRGSASRDPDAERRRRAALGAEGKGRGCALSFRADERRAERERRAGKGAEVPLRLPRADRPALQGSQSQAREPAYKPRLPLGGAGHCAGGRSGAGVRHHLVAQRRRFRHVFRPLRLCGDLLLFRRARAAHGEEQQKGRRPRLGRGTGQPCPRPAGRFSAAGALCAPCRAHAHDPHPARGPRPERR